MRLSFIHATLFALALLAATPARAAGGSLTLLLDDELIDWLKQTAAPLVKEAGFGPDEITFNVVAGEEVNAFVTPEKKIYLYSALLLKAEKPEEVQGVLAHELGHLKGRHHFRFQQDAEKLTVPTILSGLAGIGAAVAGAPQAGAAILIGGQAAATSQLLQYSRTQEREADTIAAGLLGKNNYSMAGMLSFFDKLRTDELLYNRRLPAYLQSHPLTTERLDTARGYLDKEKAAGLTPTPLDAAQFKRFQAKLAAFISTPANTLRRVGSDNSPSATYARAIAIGLQGKLAESAAIFEKLLADSPNDPYYMELLAQLRTEQGRYDDAAKLYDRVLALKPNANWIRVQYGQTLLAAGRPAEALPHLQRAVRDLKRWPQPWRQLGVAYGSLDQQAESHLALVEEALLLNNKADAKLHLKIAEKGLERAPAPTKAHYDELKKHMEDDD